MGCIPTTERADIVYAWPRLVGYITWNMWDRGKYPTRGWAEPGLSRDPAIERAQHGAGDRGGAVAAAEFARLASRGKGAVDGGLDGAGGLRGPVMAMTVGEPVEHERGGKNHGSRIGEPLTHDVGRGAVAGLEHRVRIADVGRGRHAHAADQAGGQIRDDVAEHVLHHHYVEVPRPPHQHGRTCVDVEAIGGDVGIARGAFVEHAAEEGVSLEGVRLVDAGEQATAPAYLAPARQAKGEIEQALRGLARDQEGLARFGIGHHALAHGGEQTLGGFEDSDKSGYERGVYC